MRIWTAQKDAIYLFPFIFGMLLSKSHHLGWVRFPNLIIEGMFYRMSYILHLVGISVYYHDI